MNRTLVFLSFIFCVCFANAQNNEQKREFHDDIISVSKKYFSKEFKYLKKTTSGCCSNMFIGVGENSIDFIANLKSKNTSNFRSEKDSILLTKIISKEEVRFYKTQIIKENFKFDHFELETDSVFVYNKKRDQLNVSSCGIRMLSKRFIKIIPTPLFTRDRKYAIFTISSSHLWYCVVYKKENDDWSYCTDFNLLFSRH